MSNKQRSVKISQEQKAILTAFCGLASKILKDGFLSIKEAISGGILSLAKGCENKPNDPQVLFYLLTGDESIKTTLLNRLPDEIKERDIEIAEAVPDDAIECISKVQNLFGEDWDVSSGNLKGHKFSYKGEEGKQKLIFSWALDYVIQNYFTETYGDQAKEKQFDMDCKGQYLKPGDVLNFYVCRTTKSFVEEDGRKGYFFTYYELTVNIRTRTKKTRPAGQERSIPEKEREIPFDIEQKTIDFDLGDDFER